MLILKVKKGERIIGVGGLGGGGAAPLNKNKTEIL